MIVRKCIPALALLLAVCWQAGRATAAVAFIEDLSACKLPNAMAVLPAAGTRVAQNGDLLSLSSSRFSIFPTTADGRVLGTQQALLRLRESGTGDLQYLPDNDGSLLAVSGRISELGVTLLSDAAQMKLSVPMEIRQSTLGPAAVYPGVGEGRTYLVETADGHYALVRILEKTKASLVIQYVYQPASMLSFDVPPGNLLEYRRPAAPEPEHPVVRITSDNKPTTPAAGAAATEAQTPSATGERSASMPPAERVATPLPPAAPKPALGPEDRIEPGVIILRSGGTGAGTTSSALEPSMDAFMRQRNQMVQRRMLIVATAARTPADIDKKVQAIIDLGNLHADEAADLLVSQISFFNARGADREFSPDSLHPCFGALKKLGTPATVAVVKALRVLDPDAPGLEMDSPTYRALLMDKVLRAVEGDDVAEFILKREIASQNDPKRRALLEYLLKN